MAWSKEKTPDPKRYIATRQVNRQSIPSGWQSGNGTVFFHYAHKRGSILSVLHEPLGSHRKSKAPIPASFIKLSFTTELELVEFMFSVPYR